MKDLEKFLNAVADGLKVMAQGISTIADKVNEIAKEQGKEESPIKKAPKVAAKAAKKETPKKAIKKPVQGKKPQVDKPDTAGNTVLKIIENSKDGINIATLMKKTGYSRQKIDNCLYKLKKQGKIKNVNKGIYSAM
ncbi:MAG: hypothetical protein Q8P24_11310 [Desulfobacterales bacterium]|nr:hypothetical protein [Desulfobacterales bacterium]